MRIYNKMTYLRVSLISLFIGVASILFFLWHSQQPNSLSNEYRATALLQLAQQNLGSGNNQAALSNAIAALNLDPQMLKAYQVEGDALRALGGYNLSVAALTKAINLDPSQYQLYLDRSYSEQMLSQNGSALQDVRQALILMPAQPDAYDHVINQFIALGDGGDAVLVASRSIALSPTRYYSYEMRARGYAAMQGYGDAARDLEHALALSPSPAVKSDVLVLYAQIESQAGYYDRALALAQRALRASASQSAYQVRGDVYSATGHINQAITAYLDGVAWATRGKLPDQAANFEMQAAALAAQQGDVSQARSLYQGALSMARDTGLRASIMKALQALPGN